MKRVVLFDHFQEPLLAKLREQPVDSNSVILSVVPLIFEASVCSHSVQHNACCPQLSLAVLGVPDNCQYLFACNPLLIHDLYNFVVPLRNDNRQSLVALQPRSVWELRADSSWGLYH